MKTKGLFFFTSSRKNDKVSQITILSRSARRAYAMAVMNFKANNYKGTPIELFA